jgi:uncharacterized protein YjaG (DUF416 family)
VNLIHYNEQELIRRLEQLSPTLRAVFAAACAERLLPAYFSFSEQTGKGDSSQLAMILERLWADLQGNPMSTEEMRANLDVCMSLVPQEGEDLWVDEQVYAEDAAAALAYALRCRQSGESQEAAWAARRAYEAVDYYVINRVGIDVNQPGGEEQALSNDIVQTELVRQYRDIKDLLSAVRNAETTAVVSSLWSRARIDAIKLFKSDDNDL